jgi:hypothetical protein
VSRDFRSSVFFNQTILPIGPLFTGWSRFRKWLRIRRENRDNHLQSSDSSVSLKPRDQIPQAHWNRGRGFSGVMETAGSDPAEFDSSVSMRPQDRILQSNETAESFMTPPRDPLRKRLLTHIPHPPTISHTLIVGGWGIPQYKYCDLGWNAYILRQNSV